MQKRSASRKMFMHNGESRLVFECLDGIPADAPCLNGHFPENPIVPGAMLLAYAARFLSIEGIEIAKISRLKFLNSLLPNQSFKIEFVLNSDDATITWSSNNSVLARARMSLRKNDNYVKS